MCCWIIGPLSPFWLFCFGCVSHCVLSLTYYKLSFINSVFLYTFAVLLQFVQIYYFRCFQTVLLVPLFGSFLTFTSRHVSYLHTMLAHCLYNFCCFILLCSISFCRSRIIPSRSEKHLQPCSLMFLCRIGIICTNCTFCLWNLLSSSSSAISISYKSTEILTI